MQKRHDDSKACLTTFVQDNTVIAVIEMSLANWLVAGMIPGVNREPLKKIAPDPEVLLRLLYRWRDEAIKAGKEITRIAVAYETGRDSFWLARWLRDRGVDAHVIHATSVAISREPRKPMIVALARKLIIALWRYVHTGMVPEGFKLRAST